MKSKIILTKEEKKLAFADLAHNTWNDAIKSIMKRTNRTYLESREAVYSYFMEIEVLINIDNETIEEEK